MSDDELNERVRALRTKGLSPKQVARALGIPPAVAARAIQAIAAADAARLPGPPTGSCGTAGSTRDGVRV